MLLLHKDYHSLQAQITAFLSIKYFLIKVCTFCFLGDSVVKNLPVNAAVWGSIPGLGKSPAGGNDNSL